ncbi:DUF262 domain-containing HNH endonuclease family protein [Empedobacter sp.]|uniref:DUF262 domain-containing protein n=1 Tax=Empedobacter sp. TaxID=1927715 RepID=UPI0028977D4E|nr:DUF262 domain-containing HNH endonuclease family protein [Empedobacter sp.]
MEASTTIQQMLAGNKIFVPSYQRAYSWETEFDNSKTPKQTNVFLSDLEDYNRSSTTSSYYFGHFLFEEKDKTTFGVVDGQQRLTTIVIFLSALFKKLESIRPLTEKEEVAKEDMILRKSAHRFETVDYDKQLFKDYVVNQTKKDKNGLDTESAKRIVNAFDFFNAYFSDKDETYLLKMLETVQNASCTTHPVKDESEAIQMFIFQNNRGKKPSNLEIIKAQFMFNVHLFGGEEKEALIEEIKSRFEKIYKSISSIEYRINEDEVLTYTLRVHFNSLWENNAIDKINSLLSEANPIPFIKLFTQSLATSFEHLTTFFGKDERENLEIHSLITLGGIGIAIPFIIKAYSFGLSTQQINQLCNKLESVVLRHRLIGTRADITSRLNGVYKEFTADNPDINPIIDRINWLKVTQDWWWAYWNDTELERALQGGINHPTAKYLLWKYENHLENQGKSGYTPTRFDKIEKPELEHIAPQTDNPESGYDKYDEEFVNQYINCLGNYLLLSKSHNCSVGNKPFADKRNSYNHLEQQREIQRMTIENIQWTRELIQSRKEKIVEFIMENV